LVASNGSQCLYLTGIGPVIEYIEENETMNDWVAGSTFKPGIWVIEVDAHTRTYRTDYGDEYDLELDYGEERMATDDEVRAHAADEWPWDPGRWMENWPEVRDWSVKE
jgi:hypothetical protein